MRQSRLVPDTLAGAVHVPDRCGAVPVSRAMLDNEARRLWDELPSGGVVWLSGELGAGKTTFVQAIVAAAGGGAARSPTYALVHEYASPHGPLFHADCYRLRNPEEALDLDFPDLVRRGRLVLIEWPERAGRYAPPPHVHVKLAHAGIPEDRLFERIA